MSAPLPRTAVGALLRKDAPWILFFAAMGVAALVVAIGDGSHASALVLDRGRHEPAFHTAWIAGLALGLVAAAFDGALGTNDLLRQRPVSASALLRVRLLGVGLVLAAWLVLAPVAAVLWMWLFEVVAMPDPLALGTLLASLLPAVSAAAIGLAAAAVPIAWWLRPYVAGAMVLAWFSAVDSVLGAPRYTPPVPFAVAQLVAAVACVWLALRLRGESADADRPLSGAARHGLGALATVAVVAVLFGALRESEGAALSWLRNEYPAVVVHGDTVKLVERRSLWRKGGAVVVDASHAATGEVIPLIEVDSVPFRAPRSDRTWLGFDAPRWHRGVDYAWFEGSPTFLVLRHDGQVFVTEPGEPRALGEPVGKAGATGPFGPGATLFHARGDDAAVVLFEREARRAWRFDVARRTFLPLDPPEGDRLLQIDYAPHGLRYLAAADSTDQRLLFRGERDHYVLGGDSLVRVPASELPKDETHDPEATVGGDPVWFTLALPAAGTRPEFRHDYAPRTGGEWLYAGAAIAAAALQPLPANLVGRPAYAVVLTLLLTALAGLAAWRHLRRAGAPAAVRRYWSALAVVLGPMALLPCCVFETARAHRARPGVAAPPPRIVTPPAAADARA